MARQLPLFISHGAPDLVLRDTPARDHLKALGASLPRPRAIVSVSAHFETRRPAVVVDDAPGMIYDFGGFDPRLYEMVYPAPGDRALASDIAGRLAASGLTADELRNRGYDHGTWVPLMLLFPDADVPVVQLSVQPQMSPAHHLALGRALAPLADEDVLIVGTGALTHNLREAFRHGRDDKGGPAHDWVKGFADWFADRLSEGAVDDLLDYRARAPFALQNHPTDEHLLPIFVALGAAGPAASGRRIHSSAQYGALAMDCFAFGTVAELDGVSSEVESIC
ncbi:4,5-DOPA dioxygenase extradiol [Rhodobium orientis]|uniref:Dioxygenase n=1 Tax=Rhodobium orientis TaxID=34017 RepID=A0A327JVL8_9HYPH|nr:class III extradiol ring-cleavage dioxygenase [Rhodobium orientis]MBB4304036.1 4,5-DOPA dioxygenase extradiol [Rhodobium orientis]MBK5950755.1 dioxygenase [Rhodobium orientis]RAI29574.1 dioxygenase [Rhodobium orientis]